jgi:hypothetical protein
VSRGTTALLTFAALLLATGASARSLSYTVPVESSLERLARDLYGRSTAAPVLAAANARELQGPVAAGTVLRVPVSYRALVRKQSTLSALARTHLKRKSRGAILAAVNGLDENRPVGAGTALLVPALVWHTARKGETLLGLSRQYYRNTDGRFVLRKVNGDRKGLAVAAGEKLIVPIFADWSDEDAVRTRLAGLQGPAAATVPDAPPPANDDDDDDVDGGVRDAAPDAGTAPVEDARAAYAGALESPLLRDGVALYRRGDYLACVAYFRRALLDPGLPPWPRVASQVWLASCYVATDENDRAEEAMRAALGARPELQLDPTHTSPKVLQVLERARSQRR